MTYQCPEMGICGAGAGRHEKHEHRCFLQDCRRYERSERQLACWQWLVTVPEVVLNIETRT